MNDSKPVTDNEQNTVERIDEKVSDILNEIEEAVKKFDERTLIKSLPKNPLPATPKKPNMILNAVQSAIVNLDLSKDDEEPHLAILPSLSSLEKLSISSHSIVQYVLCLDTLHSDYLFKWIYGETTTWLAELFRTEESDNAIFDDNISESIAVVFKMIICQKYPAYCTDGYHVFQNKEPIIYVDSDNSASIAKYVCRSCSLPSNCVRKIELSEINQNILDFFEMLVLTDIDNGKIPLMVLIETEIQRLPCNYEEIKRFQHFCRQHEIWIHRNGSLLAARPILPDFKKNHDDPRDADSITIKLGNWLNIPALPSVTLYSKSVTVNNNYTDNFNPSRNIFAKSLPIWVTLQCIGSNEIKSRFAQKFESCQQLYHRLQKFSSLKLINQYPRSENAPLTTLLSKATDYEVLEQLITSVTFKFIPENEEMWSSNYCDKLNSWLNQVLSRELPEIRTTVAMTENNGLVLQYNPFESTSVVEPSIWEHFYICLEQQLDILKCTVTQKNILYGLLKESVNLKLVELQDWAGLGGVRYIPQGWDQILTDHAKNELNRLNVQIVNQLRNTDSAFSIGEGDDGLACIRFGMIGSDTDVTDLINLVETIGKQEENSWNFIDTMAEVVKKGIETATVDLQKENEDKLWQEGILRNVPVFGSLVNWWSPIRKDNDIVKGRTLDLTAGVISSTENIYRYHVQGPIVPPATDSADEIQNVVKIPLPLPKKKISIEENNCAGQNVIPSARLD